MEQLKPILSGLFRNHFWILCGVIAPVLMGGWFTETARMQDERDTRVKDIKGWFDDVSAVTDEPEHPNTIANTGMDQFIEELKAEVNEAWEYQYEQQAKILVWPEELKQDFIDRVENIRPIEQMAPDEDPLGPSLRERYRDYIQAELPKLARIVGAKWAPSAGGGMEEGGGMFGAIGGGGGMSGGATKGEPAEEDDEDFAVTWSASDQSDLQFSRFDWSSKGSLVPSSLEILYAQEDLWVLRALMNIVADTNTDESGSNLGIIKEIVSIKMGGDATESAGSIGSAAAGGMSALDRSFLGGDDEEGGSRGGGGMDIFGGMSRGPVDPAQNRYVDTNYKPIRASTLRTVLSPENDKVQNKEEVYLVVAKRMPVRLNLIMDSRKVHRLISACGNSDLVVEVRQVRINTNDLDASGMGGLSDSDNPMAMMGVEVEVQVDDETTGFEALGGGPESGGGDLSSGALAEMDIEEEPPIWELPVQIYGIVYIYNPVNRQKLQLSDEELAKADGVDPTTVETTPAETPADTTTTEPPAAETATPDTEADGSTDAATDGSTDTTTDGTPDPNEITTDAAANPAPAAPAP